MAPWIRAPRATAESQSSRTMTTAPSPSTKPDLVASEGRGGRGMDELPAVVGDDVRVGLGELVERGPPDAHAHRHAPLVRFVHPGGDGGVLEGLERGGDAEAARRREVPGETRVGQTIL